MPSRPCLIATRALRSSCSIVIHAWMLGFVRFSEPIARSPLRRLQLLFRVVDEDFPAHSALLAPRGNEEFP